MTFKMSLFTNLLNGQKKTNSFAKNAKNYGHLHDPAGGKNPNPGDLLIYKAYCNCQNLGTFLHVDNEKICLLFEVQIVDLGI